MERLARRQGAAIPEGSLSRLRGVADLGRRDQGLRHAGGDPGVERPDSASDACVDAVQPVSSTTNHTNHTNPEDSDRVLEHMSDQSHPRLFIFTRCCTDGSWPCGSDHTRKPHQRLVRSGLAEASSFRHGNLRAVHVSPGLLTTRAGRKGRQHHRYRTAFPRCGCDRRPPRSRRASTGRPPPATRVVCDPEDKHIQSQGRR